VLPLYFDGAFVSVFEESDFGGALATRKPKVRPNRSQVAAESKKNGAQSGAFSELSTNAVG
jgi:hypothetical protein